MLHPMLGQNTLEELREQGTIMDQMNERYADHVVQTHRKRNDNNNNYYYYSNSNPMPITAHRLSQPTHTTGTFWKTHWTAWAERAVHKGMC